MNSTLRRWITTVTAPATSTAMLAQKVAFWAGIPLALATIPAFAAGWLWTAPLRSMPVWVYVLLVVTRQRDEARTEASKAREGTTA